MYTRRTKEELLNHGMKPHAIKAFLELQKMGIACMTWDSEERGHFWIWTEGLTIETDIHVDYYENYWGSDKLNKILEKNGLYHEWLNPAVTCIYDN